MQTSFTEPPNRVRVYRVRVYRVRVMMEVKQIYSINLLSIIVRIAFIRTVIFMRQTS